MAILALSCIVLPAFSQVPVNLAPVPHLQFVDGTGKLLSGGEIFTYAAGTTTRLDSYTDSSGTIINAWPIPLDATGSPSNGSTQTGIWLSSAAYKFCVYNSALVQQWCVDNIIGPPFLAGNNNWTGANIFSGTTTFNAAVILSAGGTFSGSISGSPTFTGGVVFSGNPLFTGSPNFTSATPVWPTAAQANLNPEILSVVIANGAGGTTQNSIAKLTGAPSTAVLPVVADTAGAVGIVTAGAGTTGSATIQKVGLVNCNFDAATTAGDYVVFSATVAGDCHDVPGGGFPSSGQVLGRALSSNAVAGLYQLDLFPSEDRAGGGASGGFPSVVYSVPSGSTNANTVATTMATVGASNATYRFSYYFQLSGVGTSCAGPTNVQGAITFTDPLAAGSSIYVGSIGALAATNGVLGPASGNAQLFQTMDIRAKAGTLLQYSVAYTLGTSCSPGPSYVFYPILEQLTAN